MKRPRDLEIVALRRDLPEFRLRAGHTGTVVLVYNSEAVEVEFFDREGETHALLTLLDSDLREPTDSERTSSDGPDPWPPGVEPPIADATAPAKR